MKPTKIFFLIVTVLLARAVFAEVPPPRWAMLDGNAIHYYDIGDTKQKKALVFVHGWTCDAEFWKESYRAFPQYRVIVVDLPGHGLSDKPRLDYTMDHFARAVNRVLETAGVESAVLVGHSMGTPVIRQFYRRYQGKTLALVIVDGVVEPYLTKEAFEKFFAPIRADYVKNAPNFIDGMLAPVKDAELRKWIRSRMLLTPEHVALSAMDGMGEMSIWEKDKINVPVMTWLARSPAMGDAVEEKYRAVAPDLEFHIWDGVSHFLMIEQPALFNGQLKGFVMRRKLL
ncbi:alpha/beta fold hydrolase [Leptolyngbya sp. 7M]|uniref:alpha/beta fold hydrolase n=1 Tax=Leptolyngbya sp. 7M TaxID=2812896 RepID=UPI001B8D5F92|nr:alpha/beta hydrolase [Leptolyngbya sp. 7M]QYO67718.1 alpha/beta hydrolase [Leptolyngbya sp. 7M]